MVERVYQDRAGVRIDNDYNWLNEPNLDPGPRAGAFRHEGRAGKSRGAD
jgi:hypothetical protein